jgi:murein endopeptidase
VRTILVMRSLLVVIGLFAFAAVAEAKPKNPTAAKRATKHETKQGKRTKHASTSKGKKRVALAKERRLEKLKGPIHGQSVGAPWNGRLRNATRLPDDDGYHIRRPWRAYGTKSMVEAIFHVAGAVREKFPDIHVLAIGDLSAERGGHISEHSSHQSGRDVDLGLIYFERPRGYPDSFIVATEDNLDCEATFALVEELAKTGRVHMMFLDFKVQGLLYDWARANDVDEQHLATLFQFPHGRGTSAGLVRHEPNHADHLHVRFRCPNSDNACR